ncbi:MULTISPECIES: LapA family protein [unclassified Nostoc]|uniref:LapA family protein n=1 Tax=unclassified Nostoc TaxID=2593658 RepID=UPI002AD3FABE|nr:LapA family protein [Nostoc sp. DedQUE03]MDZ7972959.1 LapA family protein [Nostoc sp. DedQUE03]MDZ8044182.1 LapA family protein [Nostoc sp. DedQUE02]
MAVIRLILLVAVLGGLTLLLIQNFSPALSLVFLGVRTQPLPLAIWILFSTTTGAFTSILIATLFNLSNYFVAGQRQTPNRVTATSSRAKATQREEPASRSASPPPASKKEEPSSEVFDDWETNGSRDDDWNFYEKSESAPTPNSQAQQPRDSTTYERQSEAKRSSQSGSVYSYSYREPKNTAAGKTESVYDADYRVIIPPYQPPTTNQADDDDWDFFEDDDDFEDDGKRPRR